MLDLGKKYLIYHTPGHWRLGAISETTSSDFCGKQKLDSSMAKLH
jgi:hypothetical protein